MMNVKVLVTGANGQLGKCIEEFSERSGNNIDFVFMNSTALDITSRLDVERVFKSENFEYCINCGAYTAVDKAEEDIDIAHRVNVIGVRNLAELCNVTNTILIHISTDFVFDGTNNKPYTELDKTNPISVYGLTKLKAEEEIYSILKGYFIIRTSWLYSEYGNNFVKTMLKLSKTREKLEVVSDQVGTPTYAKDLVSAIITLINNENFKYGIYHYSNEGVASWYDFARAIFEISKVEIKVNPILTSNYPTLAKRPYFSVLDKTKIKLNLEIKIPHWRDSLKKCLYGFNDKKKDF